MKGFIYFTLHYRDTSIGFEIEKSRHSGRQYVLNIWVKEKGKLPERNIFIETKGGYEVSIESGNSSILSIYGKFYDLLELKNKIVVDIIDAIDEYYDANNIKDLKSIDNIKKMQFKNWFETLCYLEGIINNTDLQSIANKKDVFYLEEIENRRQ